MIIEALKHRYSKSLPEQDSQPATGLESFLNTEEIQDNNTALLSHIRLQHPEWTLSREQVAILACVDDCSTLIFSLSHTDSEVENILRKATPVIAKQLLLNPDFPLDEEPSILDILDELNDGLMGWLPDLGAGGNKLKAKLDSVMSSILSEEFDTQSLHADVSAFMDKESKRTNKQEERLAASETGMVRAQQSKVLAATMINKATKDQQLTLSLIEFLYGPWYDSAQLIIINKGLDSEEWRRAEKITETLIQTYKATDKDQEGAAKEQQYLYRIIEHLPNEIRDLLVALAHNTDRTEEALETIETDHVTIVSGLPLEYVEFEPLESGDNSPVSSRVSSLLMRKIERLEVGQWFVFSEAEQATRIKLVLKLDDVRQLLFTNRNGMKVLQKSYEEFAYYLSSHSVRLLNQGDIFSSTYRNYYTGLMNEYEKHRKLIAERKIDVEEQDVARKAARVKALKEAKELALVKDEAERSRIKAERESRLKAAKIEAGKEENADQLSHYKLAVAQLNTGALLTLPDNKGQQIDCSLAVKISSADKLIFVDEKGLRLGEYSSIQLVQLLVAEQATIKNDGIEFEDTLAQVVSKLRSDRNKSYDDLTGE